jgi:hypothetical protein
MPNLLSGFFYVAFDPLDDEYFPYDVLNKCTIYVSTEHGLCISSYFLINKRFLRTLAYHQQMSQETIWVLINCTFNEVAELT